MIYRILKTLFPKKLKARLRLKLQAKLREWKAPKMIWGFQNPDGRHMSRTRVSDTTFFNHPENVHIDDNVFIGHYCILDGTAELRIGTGCQIAGWTGIYTHSSQTSIRLYGSHYLEVPELEKIGFRSGPVRLGKYVFVGAGAKIFSGVTIGDGAFIQAGAIVTKDVAPFAIVAGAPATVIGDARERDSRYLEDAQLRAWYEEWQSN